MAIKTLTQNQLSAARLRRIAKDLILEAEALEADGAEYRPRITEYQRITYEEARYGQKTQPRRTK